MNRFVCAGLLCWFQAFALASAAVLDWSSVSYPQGSLSQTFNNVDGSGANISVDFPLTITTGSAIYPTGIDATTDNDDFSPRGNPQSPEINQDLTSADALYLELDFDARNTGPNGVSNNEYATLQLDFGLPGDQKATDVNFTVFDIDFNANDFQDLVVVVGVTQDGTLVAPDTLGTTAGINARTTGANTAFFTDTIYDAANMPSDPTLIENSGVVGLVGQTAEDGGSATWDFGDQELTGLIFVYTNGRDAPNPPDGQAVALGNIFFTVVPEAETYWAGGLLLLLGVGWELRRRRAS